MTTSRSAFRISTQRSRQWGLTLWIAGAASPPSQKAAYFHTGGTTGRPKLAQLTHGNMAFLGQLMQVYTAHMERHTVLCGLPLFHIYGCIIQGVAAFAVGYRIVLMTPAGFRSPRAMMNFWKHVERFQVKAILCCPHGADGTRRYPGRRCRYQQSH